MVGNVGKQPISVPRPSAALAGEALALLSAFGSGNADLKAVLEQLKEAQTHNQALVAEANEKIAKAEKVADDAIRARREAENVRKDGLADVENALDKLHRKEEAFYKQQAEATDDLEARIREVDERERAVAASEHSISAKEADLDERIDRLAAAERHTQAKMDESLALIEAYNQKLQKLRDFVS